jgi:hypothetical protein
MLLREKENELEYVIEMHKKEIEDILDRNR